jgi:hypothetical protein
VAPRPAAHAHLAKKFLSEASGRGSPLRCLLVFFYFLLFAGTLFKVFNRGNLIFSLTKLGGFLYYFYFLFFYFWRTDRTLTPRSQPPSFNPLHSSTAARHGSRSFTLPCQAGPTKSGDRLSHYGPRVCSRSCASPTSVTLLPSPTLPPSLARTSTILVCRFGKSNYPGT